MFSSKRMSRLKLTAHRTHILKKRETQLKQTQKHLNRTSTHRTTESSSVLHLFSTWATETAVVARHQCNAWIHRRLRRRRITSSPSQTLRRRLVRTTDDGRRGECSTLAAVRRGFVFTLRHSYGWQNSRRVCSEARYPSRIAFFSTPPAFDAPVREVPVGISSPCLVPKN